MSTTLGILRSESLSKECVNSMTSNNEVKVYDGKTLISNLKKSSINNKLRLNRNEKLSSFVNIELHKKRSSFLNTSKLVITEKDSKKEDSERTDKNQSGRKKYKHNTPNIVIEGILNSNRSNFSGLKNSTFGSKLSHIFSDHSLKNEKSGRTMNVLKTNKPPKLLNNYKELSSNNMNYNKITSQANISILLNSSKETFNKYKYVFGDVDSPSKLLRMNSNSVQLKNKKEQFTEESDLSTIRNNVTSKHKAFNNIFTFRKQNESIIVNNKEDLLRIKNEVININNEMNLKRFHSIGNYK